MLSKFFSHYSSPIIVWNRAGSFAATQFFVVVSNNAARIFMFDFQPWLSLLLSPKCCQDLHRFIFPIIGLSSLSACSSKLFTKEHSYKVGLLAHARDRPTESVFGRHSLYSFLGFTRYFISNGFITWIQMNMHLMTNNIRYWFTLFVMISFSHQNHFNWIRWFSVFECAE